MSDEHIHDCTGPDMTCPCGYRPVFMPVSWSMDIFAHGKTLISEGFSCESLGTVADELREIADKIDNGEIQ